MSVLLKNGIFTEGLFLFLMMSVGGKGLVIPCAHVFVPLPPALDFFGALGPGSSLRKGVLVLVTRKKEYWGAPLIWAGIRSVPWTWR